MNLKEIKNGQHFCLVRDPKKIYKKIASRIRLYSETDNWGNDISEGRSVVDALCLETGQETTFKYPDRITVIELG